jgi:hypothetical protein
MSQKCSFGLLLDQVLLMRFARSPDLCTSELLATRHMGWMIAGRMDGTAGSYRWCLSILLPHSVRLVEAPSVGER